MNRIIFGENLEVLRTLPTASVDLIYIDPPFNTGKVQKRTFIRTTRDEDGDRTGFKGQRYKTEDVGEAEFNDRFEDYWGFLEPRVREAYRVLKDNGSFYFHVDYREVHYCKVALDGVFGRTNFLNEVIWAYDYGAKTKRRWPPKHDNILVYVKDRKNFVFNVDEIDRIPYMAPDLAGPEKAARGKLPTDVWFHTIVSPTGKEKLGYPTQKPLGVLRRIVRASCPRGGVLLDFFAGTGTAGMAALELGRGFILVDNSPLAYAKMLGRFSAFRSQISFEPEHGPLESPSP
jgi:site-specific DNA-methyltransferase (adenine-specific)